MRKSIYTILIISMLLAIFTGCAEKAELGSESNPIKMYFVPSVEADRVVLGADAIADILHKKTGYFFDTGVPTSYAAVVEGLGTEQVDIGWLPTFAYILASKKYGAQVALTVKRRGETKYRGQFVAKADSGIETVEDIQGKTIAYTDAASTSGHIYPSLLLATKDIKPSEVLFAGGHPQAILSVYQGQADAGCTYWSPPDTAGIPMDARRRLLDTHPDIFEKIKIIGYTDWIPNGTVTYRKGFSKEMGDKIVKALLEYVESDDGREILSSVYNVDGFKIGDDTDYDGVRNTLKTLKLSAESFIEK